MAVVPYMPLYVADYMADTQHLTTLEHGAYMLLIMAYWQSKSPLRALNGRLANVARLPDEQWKTVEPTLREFFEEKDGFWHHKRISSELDHFRAKSEQNSRAGRASAEKRRIGRLTPVQRPLEQNGNHTDTDTDIKKSREHTTVRTGTGSAEKPNGSVSVRFPYLADDSFKPFIVAACALWPDLIEEDLQSSWQFTWKKWDFEQKALCVKNTQARVDAGDDGRFVTRPPKYLESGDWKRPPRNESGSTSAATRAGGNGNGAVRESATERAIRIGHERIRKEGRL